MDNQRKGLGDSR